MTPWLLLPGTLCQPRVFAPLLAGIGAIPPPLRTLPQHAGWESSAEATAQRHCLPMGEVCLMSFSLGNFVAMELALALGPRCRGLVMFGATGRADRPEAAALRRAQLARAAEVGRGVMLRQNLLPAYFGDDPARAETLADVVCEMADETPQADFAAQTDLAISRPDYLSRVGGITASVLIVTGTADRATPPDRGEELAAHLMRATVRSVEGAGHFALLEDPDACARAVVGWLERDGA